MTESMIERVARALCDENKPFDMSWESFIPEARAAILAMREPTDLMIEAADGPWCDDDRPSPEHEYRAMIDAALIWPPGSADIAGVPRAEV